MAGSMDVGMSGCRDFVFRVPCSIFRKVVHIYMDMNMDMNTYLGISGYIYLLGQVLKEP